MKNRFKITSIKPILFSLVFGSISLKVGGNPFFFDDVQTFQVIKNVKLVDDYKISEDNEFNCSDCEVSYLPYEELKNNNYIQIVLKEPIYEEDNKYYSNIITEKYYGMSNADRNLLYESIENGTFEIDNHDLSVDVVEYGSKINKNMLNKTKISITDSLYSINNDSESIKYRKQNVKEEMIDILNLLAFLYFGYAFGAEQIDESKKIY